MFVEWVVYPFLGVGLAFATYAAAALLHEGGHALFGCLFRARCLWIRVGGLLWVPGGGIFVRVKRGITPGECAILCPDQKSCVMAALGGSVMNFGTGVVAGVAWLFRGYSLWDVHPLFFAGLVAFLLCSFGMVVLNLCPGGTGMENDGMIMKRLGREERFYERLRRNQQRDLIRVEFGGVEEMF